MAPEAEIKRFAEIAKGEASMARTEVDSTRISEVIGSVRDSLSKANQIAEQWENRNSDRDDFEIINFHMENAFVQALVLIEAVGLSETLKSLQVLKKKASVDYSKSAYFENVFLVWAEKLQHYLDALESTFGEPHSKTVTKDVVEILRESVGGEPQLFDRGGGSVPGKWDGRARRGAGDVGEAAGNAAGDRRRR